MPKQPQIEKKDDGSGQLQAPVKRTDTEKPVAQDVRALRQTLEQYPAVWQKAGDLNDVARRIALQKAPALMRESGLKKVEAMEAALGYAEAPEIERLLIEQIGTCWLHLHLAEMVYGTTALATPGAESAGVLEKRINGAHKRYMKTLETLARVRRLLRPNALQVNIGAQQVNVVGEGGRD